VHCDDQHGAKKTTRIAKKTDLQTVFC